MKNVNKYERQYFIRRSVSTTGQKKTILKKHLSGVPLICVTEIRFDRADESDEKLEFFQMLVESDSRKLRSVSRQLLRQNLFS